MGKTITRHEIFEEVRKYIPELAHEFDFIYEVAGDKGVISLTKVIKGKDSNVTRITKIGNAKNFYDHYKSPKHFLMDAVKGLMSQYVEYILVNETLWT